MWYAAILLFIILVSWYSNYLGIKYGRVDAEYRVQRDAVRRGYGVFVYTNNQLEFMWKNTHVGHVYYYSNLGRC